MKKKLRRSTDDSEIDIHDEYAVEYWAMQFGVNKHKIFAAVDQVGPSASKVKNHLTNKYIRRTS